MSIGEDIEAEVQRRVELIIEDVAAGMTTIQAEINKRGGAA